MSEGSRPEDLIGSTLAGRYRILERLGEGGMATVYAAHHVTLDAKVAVKVLAPQLARDARQRKRFVREARSANRIVHEHVVRIVDFAEDPMPYFVMEYLEGEDLAHRVHRCGRMPWPEVRAIALQVLSALDAAHSLGIVHRDIKPSNIFLTRRPDGRDFVKVLDFGVAKVEDNSPEARGMTRTNEVLGTVLYMAPEQALGGTVDARSDLYSFGIVLHQLVSGEVPFNGTNPFQVIHQHLQKEPPPLPSDAPPGLDGVMARVLAKVPEGRPPSARALAYELERIGMGTLEAPPPSASHSLGFVPGPMSFAPPPSGALEGPTPARASQWIFTGSSAGEVATDPGLGEMPPGLATTSVQAESGRSGGPSPRKRRFWAAMGPTLFLAGCAVWVLCSISSPTPDREAPGSPREVAVTMPASPPKEVAAASGGSVVPQGAHGASSAGGVSPTLPAQASPATTQTAPVGDSAVRAPEPLPEFPAPPAEPTSDAPTDTPTSHPLTGPGVHHAAPALETPPPSSSRNPRSIPAAPRPPSGTSRGAGSPPPRGTTPPRTPSPPSDTRVLQDLQRMLVAECSRHDPGSLASVELEVTRDGKPYPEIHNVNAAAKSCLRATIRRHSFSPGKSRSHTLRVHLGS